MHYEKLVRDDKNIKTHIQTYNSIYIYIREENFHVLNLLWKPLLTFFKIIYKYHKNSTMDDIKLNHEVAPALPALAMATPLTI